MKKKFVFKRIAKDINLVKENNLEKQHIYINWNPDNLLNIKTMIIGNNFTPYSSGFFLFNIVFTEKYPFKPPKIEFMTQYKNIRFHPNLYPNGKVCLSLLNTWYGQKWSPSNNLVSILLILKTLFTEYPLEYEPGYFLKKKSKISIQYNQLLEYYCYKGGLIYLYKNLSKDFTIFKNIIRNRIVHNYTYYKQDIENKIKVLGNSKINFCLYKNMSTTLHYNGIYKEFNNLINIIK